MQRREFLGAIGLSALAPWQQRYYRPEFGRYVGHKAWGAPVFEYYTLGQKGPWRRMMQFPVECVIETQFTAATLRWVGYNASSHLVKRVNAMTAHELFVRADWSDKIMTVDDNHSFIAEVHPGSRPLRLPEPRPVKFVLEEWS